MPGGRNLRDGDRRNVTVLFADMKDFTSLSERMDPEEMDSLMTRVFTSFEAIVRRHGGTVEKYIGDALVAVFGVPNIHEDDPARAINTALDVLDEVSRINADRPDRIAFRIGINTGLITTGKRGEHDVVTGHAMSVASRLQSRAAVNSVLVSSATRDQCHQEFLYSDPIELSVKGKSEDLVGFQVTGRNESQVDDDSVFVGRKEIADTILQRYLRHLPGSINGVMLIGETGIGKSRLASQVVSKCRQLPDFHSAVLYARAVRYRSQPFAVIMDLTSGYFGLERSTERATAIARVQERSGVEEKTASGFADLISGESTSAENEAFVLLYLVLKGIVKRFASEPYPVMLVVDNLLFMDRQSRDFFRFFLKNADVKPFLILTDRDPEPGIQEVFGALETVAVPPLTRDEALELIRHSCPESAGTGQPPGLDRDTLNSILDNSRGNPLFIREYVRFAAENRAGTSLPTTIQNIFLTSVDPYDPPMRDLLKRLSVFAHSFSAADAKYVQETTDGDPRIVEPALSFYVRESILVRDGELYQFRYDLFKTALYDSLLNYNKRILHRVIADLMMTRENPHPRRLLLHLIRAEQFDRATEFLWRIPGLTGNLDYLADIDVLLEQTDPENVDVRLNLLFAKSAILFNNGMSDEADSLLKNIIDIAIAQRSALYAGSAYHLLTAYNMKAYCFEKARYCGQNALAYYQRAGAAPFHVQNLREIMASSELLRNRIDEMNLIVDEIRNGEDFGTFPESEAELSVVRAEHMIMRGEYQKARQLLQPLIPELSPERDNSLAAHLLLSLANFHLCDWREIVTGHLSALKGPSRHHSNISQINAQIGVGHHMLGNASSAEQRLQQAEFACSQVKNDFDQLDAYRTLAQCYQIIGNRNKAAEFAEAGIGIGVRHSASYPVLTLLMVVAEIAIETGRRKDAMFALSEAELLFNRGVLLKNRDIVLFHYFRSLTTKDGDQAEASRAAARAALQRELECIGDPELVRAFIGVRSFGRICDELLETGAGSNAAS